ncbi:DNA-processing protein DprA [Streptomyces sp. ACA25]|uniref:DNA-processing protein DprA n=1 Tax=Streptomyces sp. ACA25 TaxID=3022596 RepID=UPI0023082448|nr:DNA-processing protein DprA [Streptomyces sp. ACA25]MDB1089654.1 DNA-processing protein DprA [Streptomyces sp. ACA25]
MTGAGAVGVTEEERVARAALTRIGEPGDEVLGRWVAELGAPEVWRAVRTGDRPLTGVSAARWAGLRLRAEHADPAHDLEAAARLGARFVAPGDAEWPSQLDDLGAARPSGLWLLGSPSLRFLALRSVAVVGARACTDYGAHVAADLGTTLAQRGWTVVSGAAHGIDGAAHRGALAAGGATIAVLACGVDVRYPAAHHELLGRIADHGLLVAELPPGTRPTRSRFVQRNRVLAALTRGTVVVEAALRSGSLVTARQAARLNRPVMGVAGSIYSAQSQGVHRLLREEGTLVTGAAEVIELTGQMGELAPYASGPAVPHDLLAPATAQVLESLPAGGRAATVADIARRACTAPAAALARLHELHSLGFVERIGDHWALPAGSPTRREPGNPVAHR